jgi:farnesyl-diphosphate farnesyltransferase
MLCSVNDALVILEKTSRTFYIPIIRLPSGLQEAVASAYLCMRAIDEIEDNTELNNFTKVKLLRNISEILQEGTDSFAVDAFSILKDYQNVLPEVTQGIIKWATLAPQSIAPRIWDGTAAMADRMAYWAERNWQIQTEADLNRYTFSVAGSVGLLLSDLWAWYDGTQTNRIQSIGFGRGLQAVNILLNRSEDLSKGVKFFPIGWSKEQMHHYARCNLSLADVYINNLPNGPALNFCRLPLALAYASINALERGKGKLSRSDVLSLVTETIGID